MSGRVLIDSLVFGVEGASLQGEVPLATLARLADLLVDVTGSLAYRLEGGVGSRDRAQLLLEVDGMLSLCCQRCLEPLAYAVELRSLFEFVANDSELTQEELEDDSRDFLPAEKELDVLALIEDEILLALPTVPRHDDCVLPAARESTIESPFSVLAGLKGRA